MNQPSNLSAIFDINWSELPREVKKKVKLLLIDYFGSTIGGNKTRIAKIIREFVVNNFERGNFTVLSPDSQTTSLSGAVFANATFASALDIDDGYRLAAGHPGSSVISAALTTGEAINASGERFLNAVVIGYEIATRTGKVFYNNSEKRFFGSGAWASSGSAAASSYLYDLTLKEAIQSLGITEAHTPLSPNMKSIENGSMVKESIGWGAVTGLNGTLLAKEGFSGVMPEIFSNSDASNLDSLGNDFLLLDVYQKPYASCRWSHPAIEGVKEITENRSIDLEDIDEILIETFKKALSLNNPYPETSVGAQYSLPYIVAAYFLDREVGPEQVSSRAINRKDIRKCARKVRLKVDKEIEDRFPDECLSKVTIKTKEGYKFTSGVTNGHGTPNDPLSEKEVKDKFRWLSDELVDTEQQNLILRDIEALEERSIRELLEDF